MIEQRSHRLLPGTTLQVAPICLGTMTFGAPVEAPEAARIIDWALEHGLNFLDTANSYEGYARIPGSPGGVAEAIIGKALGKRRTQAVVATKVGNPIGPSADDRGLSRTHILRACDASLRRLQTDWIDLYYMHRPDPETPLEQSIAAFAELISAGKVRYWGLSNFDTAQTSQILELCSRHGWPRPVAHQPAYSLLNRTIEHDLLPLCRSEQLAVIPYQVLQGGLLTGKYQHPSAPPLGTRGAEKPAWIPLLNDAAVQQQIKELTEQAAAEGRTLLNYTIHTTLAIPGIVSLIVGVKRIDQLKEFLQ